MSANGTHALDEKQQEWFVKNLGVRCLHVQTDVGTPSRAVRRRNKRAMRKQRRGY